MKRKRKAFTLIELLVVIAIITLLVSILLPAIQRARDLAKQAVCRTNLRGIGTALATYQTTYKSYPFIRNPSSKTGGAMDPTAELMDAMGEKEFRDQYLKKGTTKTNVRIVDNLLMLKYTKTLDNWKIFRCPSHPSASLLMTRDEDSEYGFRDSENVYIDYAYHAGYRRQGPTMNPAAYRDGMVSMPILADQPGVSLAEFQNILNDDNEDGNDGDGYNHGQDVINALYPDAHVDGLMKLLSGPKDNNIYTIDLPSKLGKPNGTESEPSGSLDIKSRSDCVLIPGEYQTE